MYFALIMPDMERFLLTLSRNKKRIHKNNFPTHEFLLANSSWLSLVSAPFSRDYACLCFRQKHYLLTIEAIMIEKYVKTCSCIKGRRFNKTQYNLYTVRPRKQNFCEGKKHWIYFSPKKPIHHIMFMYDKVSCSTHLEQHLLVQIRQPYVF